MPWCPKCNMEYREGFTRCSDCDVPLVDELTIIEKPSDEKTYEKAGDERANIKEKHLITISNMIEYSYITSMLEQEGISYRILDRDMMPYIHAYVGRSYKGLKVFVPEESFQQAVEIVESFLQGAEEIAAEEENYEQEYTDDAEDNDQPQSSNMVSVVLIIAAIALVAYVVFAIFY